MLFKHQEEGAAWLAARARGILGDSCGLGKTRTLLQALKLAGAELPLVVCPASVRSAWLAESGLLGFLNIVVKSYDEIVRGGVPLMATLLRDSGVDSLVLDEFHKLKNPTSRRARALLGRDGYARRLSRVYLASGTPVSKNPFELWTTLGSCFPDVALEHGLRTAEDFRSRFCRVYMDYSRFRPTERIAPELRNEEEFREILRKIMLRREPDDVGLTLPRVWFQTIALDGGALDEITEGVLRDCLAAVDLAAAGDSPRITSSRKQVGLVKAPIVVKWLREQLEDSDEKVVVFAYHRAVLNVLRAGLASLGLAYIDGDTSPARRRQQIEWFQSNPFYRVFLGQQVATQEGLTLTAACRVVIVEPSWTADDNVQAAFRVARIGQVASSCVAQLIGLAGTIDEAITHKNRRESALRARMLGGNSAAGSPLSEVPAGSLVPSAGEVVSVRSLPCLS